jgi:hypothetical protein
VLEKVEVINIRQMYFPERCCGAVTAKQLQAAKDFRMGRAIEERKSP